MDASFPRPLHPVIAETLHSMTDSYLLLLVGADGLCR